MTAAITLPGLEADPVADQESAGVHDTLRLATAYRDVMESAARAQARRRA